MSEKIDYDAYLKQLGDIDTNQKNRLKAYLEEQCKYDDALRACYDPEKMDDCYEFFKKCFEKAARNSKEDSACIEDAVGYKIARDYFIEILPTLKDETLAEKTEDKPVDIAPAQETVKEVAEQIEKDAKADDVKRDEYGFEVFGEENDEPEEAAEETAEEPCHQDEVGETAEAVEINVTVSVEEDVFLSGQAFKAGDIIDKHGKRIFFKDLIPGMRFVRAADPDSLQYMVVCIVKNIKESRFSYDNNEHDITRLSYESKDYFDSVTNKCDSFGYAVPSDAMIVGKIDNGERKLFDEKVAATAAYDSEGNGLLFGF